MIPTVFPMRFGAGFRAVGVAMLWVWFAVPGMLAQSVLPVDLPVTAISRTGQFVVHGRDSNLPAPEATLSRVGTNPMVTLRPDLLVVTAERVKKAVDRRLSASDGWQSKVHLLVRDAARAPGPVSIRSQLFREGWQFYVPLPDSIEWNRLVRALVEVVLLERANRANGTSEIAQPPLWLSEGIAQLLLTEEGRDLVAEPATVVNRSQRKPDPLAPVRARLQGRDPLPFSEFSLLTLDQLSDPERFAEYQATAALMTAEVLREESGRRWMRSFLEQLPGTLNWQTALLRTSDGSVRTLLDLEKWWAVNATVALSTDPSQRWSRERVLERLKELRVEAAELRPDTNSPAMFRMVPLTEVILKWEYPLQREVLRRKMAQWQSLVSRAPADLAPLCGDYARMVHDYLNSRERAGLGPNPRGRLEARPEFMANAAVRRLDALNQRLDAELSRASMDLDSPVSVPVPVPSE